MSDLDEIQKLLRQNLELSERNNELLHKIHRSIVWRRIITIVYWVLIIGIAVGAFYFLQPILDPFLDTYDQFIEGARNISSSSDVRALIDSGSATSTQP